MPDITVSDLAKTVGIDVDTLITKLKEADLPQKKAADSISDDEREVLLDHIRSGIAAPKKITLNRKRTQELKLGGGSGAKTVSIEVRKKRTYVQVDPEKEAEEKRLAEEEAAREAAEAKAREEAEAQAKEAAAEAERLKAEAEAKSKAEAAAKPEPKLDAKAAAAKLKEEEAQIAAEAEAKRQAEAAAKLELGEQATSKEPHVKAKDRKKEQQAENKKETETPVHKPGKLKPEVKQKRSPRYYELQDDGSSGHRGRRKGGKRHGAAVQTQKFEKPVQAQVHEVSVPESITVADLAAKMAIKATGVIKALMKMGVMATINEVLDQETAVLIVEEMGHTPVLMKENALEEEVLAQDASGEQIQRAPVVTIMGHVDHGKTSLLDYIRTTKVTSGEAGGITQHIGAYHVDTPKGMITFLDTPGHAAFTAMRARGADITDIVVLVVAADDGVMPQTKEAIQHAKAAGVPLVVAVNKIDKPEADPDRIRTELSQFEVIPEAWGGENMFVDVSAKAGTGIDELLDAILLQSEVLELTAVADTAARGVVVESRLDKGRGSVATILVQSGTLRKGEMLLAGTEFGRVRAMLNEVGKPVQEAGPSIPVEVLGLSGIPHAGDDVIVVKDEKKAREVALFRQGKFRDVKLAKQHATKLESLFDRMGSGDQTQLQSLNVILKADVQGSVGAIVDALSQLSTDEVQVNVLTSGTGAITESDVSLALASSAVLFGFNVRADVTAKRMAETDGVDIRYYSVIYDLLDDVKKAMSGMLSPELREQIVGAAEVRDIFRSPKYGNIAGCLVTEGSVKRNNPIRVLRDGVVIYEGALESLRRHKDDANEVKSGTECGIGVKNYNDVKVGDVIEVYEVITIQREIT